MSKQELEKSINLLKNATDSLINQLSNEWNIDKQRILVEEIHRTIIATITLDELLKYY